MNIVWAILILGILIFVHELGHFLIAKLCRVGVIEFAIGFGPKLFQKKIGETTYGIRAIPLGGFVRMMGESREEDAELQNPEDRSKSFSQKGFFSKFAVVFAGPFFNLAFAFLVAMAAYLSYGASEPSNEPKIGDVIPGLPAEKAGLKPNDLIKTINGAPVTNWEEFAKVVFESKGKPISLDIERDGAPIKIEVSGQQEKIEEAIIRGDSEISDKYKIGVIASFHRVPVTLSEAAANAGLQILAITVTTWRGLKGMIQGLISADQIAGPLFIVSEAARSAKRGFEYVLDFMVFLSVSLALLNLLPIPILDGGHLLVFTIEALIRRPIGLKFQMVANQIGFALLMLLTLFAMSNDIRRLFFA